nr:hypothetical protein [Lactiplantibacillus plantarum]
MKVSVGVVSPTESSKIAKASQLKRKEM